jgi:hypothetical protein
LAILSGFEGDLKGVTLATAEGKSPGDLSELFDQQGRFRGKIVQSLDNSLGRRQYALTLGIELLTALFTGETKFGGMVLLACDPQRLPGMYPEAVAQVIQRVASHLDWQGIPGAHGETRREAILDQGSMPLPQILWHRLQLMAKQDSASHSIDD